MNGAVGLFSTEGGGQYICKIIHSTVVHSFGAGGDEVVNTEEVINHHRASLDASGFQRRNS